MSTHLPGYFPRLKRRLWLGALLIDALLLAWVACIHPHFLPMALKGILLGLFYLWSLTFNAENPKKGIQFAFSVLRICFFAYMAVRLSEGHLAQLAIVMSGLLSYKVILVMEYVAQAGAAFRKPSA